MRTLALCLALLVLLLLPGCRLYLGLRQTDPSYQNTDNPYYNQPSP